MKVCYILRAVPGAGKSSLAANLAGEKGVICEADYFHYVNGEYKFDFNRAGYCHKLCFDKFQNAINDGVEVVVVSNTNTKTKEWKKYKDSAHEAGYITFVLVVENHHGNDSIHGVPQETREKMAENIKNSLKLM